MELVSTKTIGPVSIWMPWTCGGLRRLVTSSFVLGYYLLFRHRVPDMPNLMPIYLLIQHKNEQWLCLPNRTRVGPLWLSRGFLPWSNCGQYWQVTLPSHTPVEFHRRGDKLLNPMGTYDLNACQVLAAQLATEMFLYELTNMIVVPDPPDGCGVFFPISLVQHISSCAHHLIICW